MNVLLLFALLATASSPASPLAGPPAVVPDSLTGVFGTPGATGASGRDPFAGFS